MSATVMLLLPGTFIWGCPVACVWLSMTRTSRLHWALSYRGLLMEACR